MLGPVFHSSTRRFAVLDAELGHGATVFGSGIAGTPHVRLRLPENSLFAGNVAGARSLAPRGSTKSVAEVSSCRWVTQRLVMCGVIGQ